METYNYAPINVKLAGGRGSGPGRCRCEGFLLHCSYLKEVIFTTYFLLKCQRVGKERLIKYPINAHPATLTPAVNIDGYTNTCL